MISNNVTRPSFEKIRQYVYQLNFLGPVARAAARFLGTTRDQPRGVKSIAEDVAAIVDHLKDQLGSTWSEACIPREKNGSKLVSPARSVNPWDSIATAIQNESYSRWIRSHLDTKVSWMPF